MSGHDDHHHDDDAHDHAHDHDGDEAHEREDAERAARRELALAQVRQYGDPVLRMRANEIETFDDELARLAETMTMLMHDADGIGLAATQIGILRRIFVFSDDGTDRVVVNPVIVATAGEPEVVEEGCLSLGPVRMPVERQPDVIIEGVDAGGAPVRLELDGLSARAVQHEVDHLDGKLILDRTDPESRREALARLRPRLLLSR